MLGVTARCGHVLCFFLFPGWSWWPHIAHHCHPYLSLCLLWGYLQGWPGAEVSLRWSDGRSTLLCISRGPWRWWPGLSAEFTWETWSFPLPLLACLQCATHVGEAQEMAKGFGVGTAHVPSGLPNTPRAWLLSWGRTSTSKGQKLIPWALPAQTYLARVKLDYLAKTLWVNMLLNGKHLIRAAVFLVAQSGGLGAPIRSVASSGRSHLLSLRDPPCPQPSARWWGSSFRRWVLRGAWWPLPWICGARRTCTTTRSRPSSNIRDCGGAACGRAPALQSADRISPFLGCQVGAKDAPGLTELSCSSTQFSSKSRGRYLKALCKE